MFKKITLQGKVELAKDLAVMLKSGISINEALASIEEQARSVVFKKIIHKVRKEIETGIPLSEAFGKEKEEFGDVFISLLKIGEASGTLVESLSFLADWLERSNDLKRDISAAMLYPKIVFTATFLLGGVLSVFILPRLIPLFKSLHVKLPLATRILMSFSLFVQESWFSVFLGIIVFFIIFSLLNRIRSLRGFFHLIYIKIPFLGKLTIDYQLALISQLLLTLFKTGLSINESLDITSKSTTNIRYQDSLEWIKDRVNKGTTISEAMNNYPMLYSKNIVNIIATGEKSGTLDNSFAYLAEFYSKELNNKIKRLPTIIEPALLVLIGLVVGFVAISIIMPIYDLVSSVSK
jgi:type II secretory pathway component PulF